MRGRFSKVSGKVRMAASPIHTKEIEAIPDTIERVKLLSLLNLFGQQLEVDMGQTRLRAEELVTRRDSGVRMRLIAPLRRPGARIL